jgi:hypothetical protein
MNETYPSSAFKSKKTIRENIAKFTVMELNRKISWKKYFDGETSVEEEKELRKYFASTDVASHLMQSIFEYLSHAAARVQQELAAAKAAV